MFTGPDAHARAGDLRAQRQRHALVGLHGEDRAGWAARRPSPCDWNARCGTGLSWTAISVTLRASRLPVRRKIGTPAQRQLWTSSLQRRVGLGARVVRDAVLLEVAARPPRRPRRPRVYCARTVSRRTSSGVGGVIACSTLTFSSRTLSASKDAGGSMHTSVSSCSMWFCTRSRSAPALVVVAGARADADVLGRGDLDVVDVVAVPDRLEHVVREPERHHVLDGLLAQVVVDAEDLALAEDAATTTSCSSRADARSVPNGFSMIARARRRRRWWLRPASLSASVITGKNSGAVER